MHLFLTGSTSLRLVTFTLLYLAQGLPIGLFTVALPAWLAEQGATAAEVGAMVAITGLPWAFKLISGPFMDRFSLLAMGRRRPWVMFAQLCLALAFTGLMLVGDPLADLWLIIAAGVVVNSFAALQDVAVDGMAIDILPPTERGRANALMAFGQVVGFSGFGAISGWLLSDYGLAVTSVVSALLVFAILALSTLVRERPGERLMPWSQGEAAVAPVAAVTFAGIFRNLLRVLLLPMSLLLIGVELLSRLSAGIYVSLLPVFAVQDLGYAAEDYAFWFGLTGGSAAVLGIFLGPMIDRFGAQRLLSISLLGSALLAGVFAMTTMWWSVDAYVVSVLAVSQIFAQGFFVSMIALFMGVCWTQVAATQFAIYMSLANLSRSLGAGVYALLAADLGASGMLLAMAGFMVAAVLLLSRFDANAHRARLDDLEASAGDKLTAAA